MRLIQSREVRLFVSVLLLWSIDLRAEPTFLLFDSGKPEAPPEMVLGEWETAKEGMMVLREKSGPAREVAESRILARLPGSPRVDEIVTREMAVTAIRALLEAKAKAPALDKVLQDEVEKWKERLDKIPSEEDPEALAKAEAAYAEALALAMPKPYDAGVAYSAEKVDEQIAALEALKNQFVGRADEVNLLASPWNIEKTELAAGKKKFEGRWLNPTEWEQEKGDREKAARSVFLQKFQLPLVSAVLLGQTLLLGSFAGAVLAALLGVSFFFHGMIELCRYRAWWKGTAWTIAGIVAIGLLGRATGLLLATPEPLEIGQAQSAEGLEELMWKTAGQKLAMQGETRLGDGELNAWWHQRLRFTPLAVTEIAVVSVDSWQIEFLSGGLRLDRVGHLLGRALTLRHELTLTRSEKGDDVYRIEATLGKLPLPPSLALWSWEAWIEDVSKIVHVFPGAEGQGAERFEKGAVVVTKK